MACRKRAVQGFSSAPCSRGRRANVTALSPPFCSAAFRASTSDFSCAICTRTASSRSDVEPVDSARAPATAPAPAPAPPPAPRPWLWLWARPSVRCDDGVDAARPSAGGAADAVAVTAPAAPAAVGGEGLALAEGDEIKITAVEENNALLIRASPAQYEAVVGAIRRLDTIPLQVHIEAKVIEVSLSDELRYGVSTFLEGAIGGNTGANGGGGGRCFGLPIPVGLGVGAPCPQRSAIRLGSGGLNYLFSNGLELAGIVDLLQSVGNTRVISSPSLVVLNNKEAKINVGQQIPITTFFNSGINTGTIPGQVNQSQGSVQYLQTGTTLTITPRVNPGGLVFMEVSQEVSAPGPVPAGGSNPPVSTRTVDTEVAVQSLSLIHI